MLAVIFRIGGAICLLLAAVGLFTSPILDSAMVSLVLMLLLAAALQFGLADLIAAVMRIAAATEWTARSMDEILEKSRSRRENSGNGAG